MASPAVAAVPAGNRAKPAPAPGARSADDERPRVALIGNPNTGKTSLFNRLCGVRAKTANFPGTTTDMRLGRAVLPGASPLPIEVVDLPGLYRLALELPEAQLCREILAGDGLFRAPDAVIVVVDATNLVRNLYLVGELLTYDLPVIVALNMIDIAQRRGLSIDSRQLAEQLGCPVLPIIARRGVGVDELAAAVGAELTSTHRRAPNAELCRALAHTGESEGDLAALEAWSDRVVAQSVGGSDALGTATDTVLERFDQAFTHPILGVLIFGLVMGGLFWLIFAFAAIPMGLIEAIFSGLSSWVANNVPPGAIRDLLAGGVIGGIAGTVVFLPQICLLFFLISLLEDTGYLARAAFVMDRLLCRFGLPGYAFVPLLASHACALPGIMSTKLIPDRQDRLATILVAPFMSCSARLPVFVLLTGLLFAHNPFLAGLAFAACYVLGALAAFSSAWLVRRTLLPGRSRAMVLELPTYKMPSLRSALFSAAEQALAFLRTAGTVILAICVLMWWLSAYPLTPEPQAAVALRTEAAASADPVAAAALVAKADALALQAHQAGSFAGRLGHAIQPVFAPLGCDWQLTMGLLTSVLAREVFVSTLSVLAVAGEDAAPSGVLDKVRTAIRDDGSPLIDPVTAATLLVFFVLAMQCLPTLAMTRRETGSWKWPLLQLAYMTSLAYAAAFATRQALLLAGFGA
jgi:ferrous iron transport protein B